MWARKIRPKFALLQRRPDLYQLLLLVVVVVFSPLTMIQIKRGPWWNLVGVVS